MRQALRVTRPIERSPTSDGERSDFFTDWFCRNAYRNHMRVFFNRKVGWLKREEPA